MQCSAKVRSTFSQQSKGLVQELVYLRMCFDNKLDYISF